MRFFSLYRVSLDVRATAKNQRRRIREIEQYRFRWNSVRVDAYVGRVKDARARTHTICLRLKGVKIMKLHPSQWFGNPSPSRRKRKTPFDRNIRSRARKITPSASRAHTHTHTYAYHRIVSHSHR